MASGISVKLPLTFSSADGFYTLNKELLESIKQNFKMLILTAPGERIWDIYFGVGLRNYLFENNTLAVQPAITNNIYSQVGTYMPFIEIVSITYDTPEGVEFSESNHLKIKIIYFIQELSSTDVLELSL